MSLFRPELPGIYVEPDASGARVRIKDHLGHEISGHLDNEALKVFGERCIAVANREHPNRIIMPTEEPR